MASLTVFICILFSLLLYRYIVHPAFLSSLSRVPNAHFTSPFSNGWILWQRFRGSENRAIHTAHESLGPIVRLGSTEISVNCVDGVKTIYGDGFERHEWYTRAFENYGMPNMFSMVHRRPHAVRKRMLASLYSKTTLQSSPEMHRISQNLLTERFLPITEAAARDQAPVDALELNFAVAMDFINAYLFGLPNGSNFLQDVKTRKRWLAVHQSTKPYGFWPLEFPNLTSFLIELGIHLVPQWVVAANDEVKDLCLEMLKTVESPSKTSPSLNLADENSTFTKPVVYDQLSSQLRASSNEAPSSSSSVSSSQTWFSLASELMDHVMAGTETSGWTLTYVMHELSQRPRLQSSLRSELLSLSPSITYPSTSSPVGTDNSSSAAATAELPAPRALDALRLLDAILLETLRLHPAVPGSQPRVTPTAAATRTTLAGYANIPGGVRVSTQAYSLHRNPDVFPEPEVWKPEVWKPERWLHARKEGKDEMMRWFWAFGSGGRMCIGSHFAMQGIYTNYTTKIIDDQGIEQVDAYSAGPKGNKLILQFERV